MKLNSTLILLFLIITTRSLYATHIVGGEFSLTTLKISTPSLTHLLTLNLYRDEINGNPGSKDKQVTVGIYSKNTHKLIEAHILVLMDVFDIETNNSTCQNNNSLKTNLNIFSKKINLSPAVYTDSQGYYIVWQRCCRNYTINNIKSPEKSGAVFYLEFPAQNLFQNSSPVFSQLTIDYICIGQPFTLNFSAKDADGDELRYSMSTPLNGFANTTAPSPNPFLIGSNNYPAVIWEVGYNENSAIQGSIPLQINPVTGILNVTADQIGLFVLAVKIEEYRNGIKIGEVRREAQMKVIECLNIEPQKPKINFKNTEILVITDCPNTVFKLEASPVDTALNYQWQLNGRNISQANASNFTATKAGEYSLDVSFKNVCSKKKQSEITKVNFYTVPVAKLTPSNPEICEGGSLQLYAAANINYTYKWFYNKNHLSTISESFFEANSMGEYKIEITDNFTNCVSKDSTILVINNLPKIQLIPNKNAICSKENTQINSKILNKNNAPYQYQWQINNQIKPNETQPNIDNPTKGKYLLTVTDFKNCIAKDSVFTTEIPETVLNFNKPSVVCHSKIIQLVAYPLGGVFLGIGIQNNTFNAAISGDGIFPIKYQYTDNNGCTNTTTQNILVDLIKIELPEKIVVYKKEPKKIFNKVNKTNLNFEWSPQEKIVNIFEQQPLAIIDTKNQIYTVKVTSENGCQVIDSVLLVFDKKIRVPTVFTPNNDRINDELEIFGLELISNFQISIFNRWGDIVFYSDGYNNKFIGKTSNGTDLPPDTYSYKIQTKEYPDQIGVFVMKR